LGPAVAGRYFGTASELKKVATVAHGKVAGPCWIFTGGRELVHGTCQDLRSEEAQPVNPVLTGNLNAPLDKWIAGHPVNDHKLVDCRFVASIKGWIL
jgi:hypothetical protein